MHSTPSLPELQRQFAAAMLDDGPSPLTTWVLGKGLTPEARLQIYRNIVNNNHAAALRTAYPIVLRLVGEDFFESAAARYFRDYPTRSGNLQDYGVGFAEFLATLPQAAGLAYLPDVARLEWARQESVLAADAEPISLAQLENVQALENLRVKLHPSLRLVSSAHPILDIWQFCQENSPGNLQLSGKPQQILVWREGAQIVLQETDAGSDALLAALLRNATLSVAHEEALHAEKNFNLSQVLHWLFSNGLVTSFSTGLD